MFKTTSKLYVKIYNKLEKYFLNITKNYLINIHIYI